MSVRRGAVSVACAVGFVTGARAIMAVDLPGIAPLLVLEALPRETFGVGWTELARWPDQARASSAARLVRTLGALILAAGMVAALNGAIVLAEAAGARRREVAIRHALGAGPVPLARRLLGEIRTLLASGIALGLVAGSAGGLALRASWPQGVEPISVGTVGPLPVDLFVLVLVVVAIEAFAHLSAVRSATRVGRAADLLRVGARATADPASIFLRRALAAFHVAVAGSILVASLSLASAVPEATSPGGFEDADVRVVTLGLGEDRPPDAALEIVSGVPGIEAESLAAPGTLLDLGIIDVATTECGNCWRGLFPAPLWNTLADHHAVSAGYFDMTGPALTEGRDFTSSDTTGRPVVIVNRRLAETAFEGGRPLGKRVRLGVGSGVWFTVVGVVEDEPTAGLGAAASAGPAIYLNASQRPPGTARLLLRGEEPAVATAVSALRAGGFTASAPVDVAAWRTRDAAPLRWARSAAWSVALLSLWVTLAGIRSAARQIARRRVRDLAIRRALGASDTALRRTLLAERVRTALWGLSGFVFFGTSVAAFVEAAAGVPPPPLATWIGIAMLLVAASAGASLEALRLVRDADPARLMA